MKWCPSTLCTDSDFFNSTYFLWPLGFRSLNAGTVNLIPDLFPSYLSATFFTGALSLASNSLSISSSSCAPSLTGLSPCIIASASALSFCASSSYNLLASASSSSLFCSASLSYSFSAANSAQNYTPLLCYAISSRRAAIFALLWVIVTLGVYIRSFFLACSNNLVKDL